MRCRGRRAIRARRMRNYGMLARDGISCTACHRMVLGKKASDGSPAQPQNACVDERQALLNPDNYRLRQDLHRAASSSARPTS